MFQLPDLPYGYDALEPHIDSRTMQIHHDLHHGGYVKNLNDALTDHEFLNLPIEEVMKRLHELPEEVQIKVRNNGGGHANHSLFWQIMGPNTGGAPTGDVEQAINNAFGSFTQFQEKFAAAALGRFGSGWAFLVVDAFKLSIVDTPNQGNPLMEGKTPILGIDVWEHAYYLKYQNRRADYIKAWWNVVNWGKVAENFDKANKVK